MGSGIIPFDRSTCNNHKLFVKIRERKSHQWPRIWQVLQLLDLWVRIQYNTSHFECLLVVFDANESIIVDLDDSSLLEIIRIVLNQLTGQA